VALEDILSRIAEDARAEAERLRADGASRAEAILASARREAARLRGELLERERGRLAAASANRLAAARLAARTRVLEQRRALLEEVLAEGLEAARGEGEGAYASWLAALVAAVPEEAGVELEVGKGDVERFGPAHAGALVREIGRLRPGWPVAVREAPASFEAGVAVRGGQSVHDFSLAVLLRERRARWETELARVLFEP